jgi:hypothetical protein
MTNGRAGKITEIKVMEESVFRHLIVRGREIEEAAKKRSNERLERQGRKDA